MVARKTGVFFRMHQQPVLPQEQIDFLAASPIDLASSIVCLFDCARQNLTAKMKRFRKNSDDREVSPTEAVRGFEIFAFFRRDFDGRNRTNTQVCLQDRLVTLPKKSICSWGSTRCWCIRKKTPVFLAIVKRNASQSAPRG